MSNKSMKYLLTAHHYLSFYLLSISLKAPSVLQTDSFPSKSNVKSFLCLIYKTSHAAAFPLFDQQVSLALKLQWQSLQRTNGPYKALPTLTEDNNSWHRQLKACLRLIWLLLQQVKQQVGWKWKERGSRWSSYWSWTGFYFTCQPLKAEGIKTGGALMMHDGLWEEQRAKEEVEENFPSI